MLGLFKKKTLHLSGLIVILLLASIVTISCSTSTPSQSEAAAIRVTSSTNQALSASGYNPNDTWTIYVYLCGSDLESNGGQATTDLNEMLEAELPDNVRVLIQTGGASSWQNDTIDPNYIERYLYHDNTFSLVDQQPSSSMGDPATLSSFLAFGEQNYPADHKVFIFWNHGSGSVYGAAFDELYDNDSLTLNEMQQAFQSVYPLSMENPPFEIIGFDTCLMSTIDTAKTFSPIAKYLVASEELEPGNGWNYTDWLNQFGQDTGINGAQLGKIICDSYVEGCVQYDTASDITLSVTDLSKVPALAKAYDEMGKEALLTASREPSKFLAALGRNAVAAENYGGNTKEQGYTNMVDIGNLAENSHNLLPKTTPTFLSALDQCVVYRVSGLYRRHATGLSGYFSYNGDKDNFNDFATISTASEPFKHLFSLLLNGKLTPQGKSYLSALGYENAPELITLKTTALEDFPVSVTEDGSALLNLGESTADLLKSVHMQLIYFDTDEDIMIALGSDNNLVADWDNGIFQDNFQNVWGAIDGHLVYMEIVAENDDYNLYSVPILINNEEYNLRVAYDYKTESYKILGARKGIESSGESDKNLRQLKSGDEITTLHFVQTLSDENDELTQVPIDTFTINDHPVFADIDLGDGTFAFMFEMTDMQNNSALSDIIQFTVNNGEITTSEM